MKEKEKIRTAVERSAKALALRPSVGQGTGVAKARVREGLRCEIEEGPWKLTADMGEASGGDGAGPSPGVLARSALSSCLAIGYAMWAAKLGVPLSSVEVEVQTDYDHRGMYGVGDVRPGYLQVRYVVTVESEASQEDIVRLLDEADAHSQVLAVFDQAQDLRREVRVVAPKG